MLLWKYSFLLAALDFFHRFLLCYNGVEFCLRSSHGCKEALDDVKLKGLTVHLVVVQIGCLSSTSTDHCSHLRDSITSCLDGFKIGSGSALGESVSFSHAQAVLYCLASNFLEVKQLACNLLQKLPPAAVRLQEPERLQSLLQVALDPSTKPFDSVTATHLLNLMLHQPGLRDALISCIQKQHIPVQPPALIQSQASEASGLEQNTLAVVQWLMVCLKEENINNLLYLGKKI
ncbi:thyroid adenoma-associated protein homolog [Cyprinus carpio]|uniref:Thyroid adenoma-associated protein homolog n=1 Tax=Cyprinus carpio TaxID=7962 RepID=A0A9R0B6R8_CYPCA|nr:thyroid adenoma-associated protein homolog [Cyprinus carpio]